MSLYTVSVTTVEIVDLSPDAPFTLALRVALDPVEEGQSPAMENSYTLTLTGPSKLKIIPEETTLFDVGVQATPVPAEPPPVEPPPVEPPPVEPPPPPTAIIQVMPTMSMEAIQAKFNALRPGQALQFNDGNYTGQWRLNPCGQAPGDKPIVIRGTPGAVLYDSNADEYGAICVMPKAHNVILQGLNITAKVGIAPVSLLTVGGGDEVTVLGDQPANVIIEGCKIWGPTLGARRAITFNAGNGGIIRKCKLTGIKADTDAQAIFSANGVGGWLIEDNELSSTGENLMLGGAEGHIVGHTISDVLIQRNRFFKNIAWRSEKGPTGNPKWSIKNLLELKRGVNIRIVHNVFEDCWAGTQNGFGLVFTMRTERKRNKWNQMKNILVEGNVIRRVGSGINILGIDYNDDENHGSLTAQGFIIKNNLIIIDRSRGEGIGVRIMTGAKTLLFENNTIVASDGQPLKFGLFVKAQSKGPPTLTSCFMHVDGLVMHKNILSGPCAGDGVPFGQTPLNINTRNSDVTGNLWIGDGMPTGNTPTTQANAVVLSTYASKQAGFGAIVAMPKGEEVEVEQ